MATAQDVLRIASNEIGYSRWDDPQEGTKYGRWYAEKTGVPYYGTNGIPFCAMFVSWVLDKAGVECNYFPSAVAFDERDRSLLGSAYVSKYNLKAGDVLAFDWDDDISGDHVGFVEEAYANYVQTIEGNTGNGVVARCTRSYSDIICGVRPFYSGEKKPSSDTSGSALVKTAQQFLIDQGFSVGSTGADGYYGMNTNSGLVKYAQTQLNMYGAQLDVDGIVGPNTKAAWLQFGPVFQGTSKHALVLPVQAALLCHKYSIGPDGIDGYCGQNTDVAIKSFQQDHVLEVDGYVGPATFSELFG